MKNNEKYRKMNKHLFYSGLLGAVLLNAAQVAAQQTETIIPTRSVSTQKSYEMKTVTGKVLDEATRSPMAGVQIQAYDNPRYAAMTDEDGTYSIKVPTFVTSIIMRVEGYNVQQVALNDRTEGVNTVLYTNAFSPDYSRTTDGLTTARATDFGLTNDMSIDAQIQQKLGGSLRATMHSGQTANGITMLMNGINSLNANAQPLVVLDGVLMDMQYGRTLLHDGYFNNLLANISVDDIEEVQVLKNGTAIYGAKGANGVLIINTKRNKSMATKIDVSISGGFEFVPKTSSVMNASQYRNYASELLGTTGTTLTDFKFLKDDPNYYYYKQYHNETDWSDEVYSTAYTQNYGINVQGGDEVANYNLSVGYALGNSTLNNNDFSRFNLRLNSDIVLMKNLTTRFDASYSDVTRDLRDDGANEDFSTSTITAPGFLSLIKSPFLSPYAYDNNGNLTGFLAGADDYLSEVIGRNVSLANPASILHYGDSKNKNDFGNRMINIAITPKYQINKNLSVQEHFSYTMVNTNENYYLPMSGVPAFNIEGIGEVSNMAQSLASRHNQFSSDTRVNWKNSYGAHKVALFGGVRFQNQSYSLTSMSGYNTGNDKTPNMSTGLIHKQTGGADDKARDITWYANADYNLKEKYYVTGGLSMAASSRFGDDVKSGLKMFGAAWGLFPSLETAWVISNESWFKPNRGVNYLKANLGFDLTGNDDISYIASRTYFTANQILRSVSGISINNIGTTELQWETTKRLTAGLTANFINNRLHVGVNFYKSWTSDLLTLSELAWVSGVKQNWINGGSLENIGVDLNVNAKILNKKNWQWEIGASLGHYKNQITALPDGSFTTEAYGGTVLSQVGSPIGVFYGYQTDGVFSSSEEANTAGLYQLSNSGERIYFGAGDMRFVDMDGNNEINENDRVVIGDPNPDIYGNLSTQLKWKRWSLNAVFNYSLGNDVYNYQRSILESGSRFFNQSTAMTNRWISEGQVTDIPRIDYGDDMGNSRFSDRWIEDGSYLRLKNLTVSYSLPIRSTYIQGFTVWAAGGNLFTLTKYLGGDPEFACSNNTLYQGIDRGLLSQGRTFTFGLKINL